MSLHYGPEEIVAKYPVYVSGGIEIIVNYVSNPMIPDWLIPLLR